MSLKTDVLCLCSMAKVGGIILNVSLSTDTGAVSEQTEKS